MTKEPWELAVADVEASSREPELSRCRRGRVSTKRCSRRGRDSSLTVRRRSSCSLAPLGQALELVEEIDHDMPTIGEFIGEGQEWRAF
jgi:hypothetical protein